MALTLSEIDQATIRGVVDRCADCDTCRFLMDECCRLFPELYRLYDVDSKFRRWEMEIEREQFICRSRRALTRLARFINQMMREQLTGTPVTVQQCYTLEALADRSMTMSELAGEVALHQSTLSRIVEKLERQGHVERTRPADNQRKVVVSITRKGKEMYRFLDSQCNQMISGLINLIPVGKQGPLLESLEEITCLLDL